MITEHTTTEKTTVQHDPVVINTSGKPVIKSPTWQEYAVSVGKIIGVVILIIIAFDGLKATQLGNKLVKVNTEIWLTLSAGGLGAFWKFYTENAKVRIAVTQANAIANANAIQALDMKVDSALIQIQELRSIQLNDTVEIQKLEKNLGDEVKKLQLAITDESSHLQESITDIKFDLSSARQQALLERIEIIQEFYKEICQIHCHISYHKGIASGIEKVLNKNTKEAKILEEELKNNAET